MTATPGQAPLQAVDSVYLYHGRFGRGEEFGLYRHKADADSAAANRAAEYPGEGLFEVLGMAVLDRPVTAIAAQQPQPAPGPLAHQLIIAVDALRDIRDEPHAGYGPVRATKALDDIGTPGFGTPKPEPGESPPLGLKHAVTSSRLGHALAALREIANPSGDEFPRDTARNALDDDAAIRDNVQLTREPKPAPELAAKPMPRVDWARVSEAVADRERERDALRELATEIIAEVSGWTRDPLDTDQLIADWRKRAAPHPENPVTGWTPGGVAPELAAAMRESRIRADVVTELLGMFKAVSGGWAARTSSKRLKRIAQVAGVHWDGLTMPAPDSDDLTELRHGITGLARDLDASAKATSPSRKSGIESETAIALRKLLET